jgi:protein-disulfide isomerase
MALLFTAQSVVVGFASKPQTKCRLGRTDFRSASAPVTIIEFSDFQCSFCKRFWAETLPKLKEAYIDMGKARFIYRHFAILGKHSEQAALAAECAAEQGKFWEYHDQLFKNQGGLAFTETKLKQYARDIGLNDGAFGTCLGTAKYREKVERETAAGAIWAGGGRRSSSSINAIWSERSPTMSFKR